MRILHLSPRQSWPPVSGAKLRDYHLARALAREGKLTWVFYYAPGEKPPTAADLPFCELVPVERPKLYTASKLAQGLIGRWSLPVVNYTSPQLIATLRGLLRGQRFDVVHVDCVHLAACIEAVRADLGQARVFYNWHNIESELMRRYSQNTDSMLRRLYAALTARRLERDENRILASAAGHVVCSEREQRLLQQRAPGSRIEVVENGVDAAAFDGAGQTVGVRNRLVFVGSMAYHANADAAIWFTKTVWPRVHQRFPNWILTLVGSDPGPDVRILGEVPGVEVTGTVPDVIPYYHSAVASVVPLRMGGGTRLKILEALAAGVPVISTAEGAEGLAVRPGEQFLLATDEGQWLPLLESLLEERRAAHLVSAGRALVEHRYDWDVIGRKLTRTYQQWLRT